MSYLSKQNVCSQNTEQRERWRSRAVIHAGESEGEQLAALDGADMLKEGATEALPVAIIFRLSVFL